MSLILGFLSYCNNPEVGNWVPHVDVWFFRSPNTIPPHQKDIFWLSFKYLFFGVSNLFSQSCLPLLPNNTPYSVRAAAAWAPRGHGMFWFLTLGWYMGFEHLWDITQGKLSPVKKKERKRLKNYSNILRLAWVRPAVGVCFIFYTVFVHLAVTFEKSTTWNPSLGKKQMEAGHLSHSTVRTVGRPAARQKQT